jgi:hypothetical protein
MTIKSIKNKIKHILILNVIYDIIWKSNNPKTHYQWLHSNTYQENTSTHEIDTFHVRHSMNKSSSKRQ